ncbi:DUF1877 family protein [Rathayibacter sp. VKM Ac-2804]|uniref:DUF1877 family protein n=1 Tax=Rathayibacter sp. VKM Ac-2804 TaxID=2609257 RepID=UPI00132E816D|nr:DUF1877 family protein [Rathayibacter sp. VKM Ac-2804]QHF23858.1 DUF1877 family protein [Rathayibacter sp. VKM Ac-2804]
MGIRYHAYAFDADQTERALADPRSVLSDDPLADAWGMPNGAVTACTDFRRSVPEGDMLHLDKAWSALQTLTAPRSPGQPPRPAHRMVEGRVTVRGMGWDPCVRAVPPDEVAEIADDLIALRAEVEEQLAEHPEGEYARQCLDRAVEFTTEVARSGRGFAYLIG